MNVKTLRQDIPAGLVVFLVALPLCLGIAQASGLPPFAGLVTIVVASIETLGSFSAFLTALVLAGLMQCAFGLLRAGRFISLVPGSVIKGILAAIGILLIIQQIPVAFGIEGDAGLAGFASGATAFSLPAMLVAAVSLLILLLWTTPLVKKAGALAWIPGPLIAVLFGCAATVLGGRLMPEDGKLAVTHRITGV